MIDQVRNGRYTQMALYALLVLALLLLRLLPLSPGATRWPGPDLTLCLTFVWVLRRPDQIPALLIAVVFLVEDLMLLRPIGLWAAFVVLASEAARIREQRWREQSFMIEWFRVSILIALMMFGYRIALAIFFLPLPSFGQMMMQLIATVMAYPVVALAARWILGLTRLDITEAEIMRHR